MAEILKLKSPASLWLNRVVAISAILFLSLSLCYGQSETIKVDGETYSLFKFRGHIT